MAEIAIVGTGKVARKEAVAQVAAFVQNLEDVSMVFVITTIDEEAIGEITPYIYRLTKDLEIPFRVVVTADIANMDDGMQYVFINELLEKATDKDVSKNPVVRALKSMNPDTDAVIIAWDDEDDESSKAAVVADSYGIPAFDITDKMSAIELSDEEDVEEEPEADIIGVGLRELVEQHRAFGVRLDALMVAWDEQQAAKS